MMSKIGPVLAAAAAAGLLSACAVNDEPAPRLPPTPTAAQTPTPTPAVSAAWYLWLDAAGVWTEQRSGSRADNVSFVLELTTLAGQHALISGGTAVKVPNAQPAAHVTVRGQPAEAYNIGAGWTLDWTEGGHPYQVGTDTGLQQTESLAQALSTIDLQTWQRRMG
jgi:hypothetical protein